MKRYSSFAWSALLLIISLSALFCFTACQKSPEEAREYGWFDFVIQDSDTTQNVVDMSFLNEGVAGSSGDRPT